MKTDYVRGNGRLLAVYTNGVPEYAHTDHLGTVQVATTDAGLMRPQTYYTPYGEAMDTPTQASARPEQDLGLTGHIRDKSTGLTYMQARYHDPVVGRFLSVDPVTMLDMDMNPNYFNRYAYAGNDPVNNLDLDGRKFEVSTETELDDDGTSTTTVTMTFTAAFVGGDAGGVQMNVLKSAIERDFSGSFTDDSGNTTRYVMNANLSSSPKDILKAMITMDDMIGITDTPSSIIPNAPNGVFGAVNEIGGRLQVINSGLLDGSITHPNASFARTGSHEMGHALGLRHPRNPANSIRGLRTNNLMTQTGRSKSTLLTQSQLAAVATGRRGK